MHWGQDRLGADFCGSVSSALLSGEVAWRWILHRARVPHRVGIPLTVSAYNELVPLVSGSAVQHTDPSAGVKLSPMIDSEFLIDTLMHESLPTSAES